MSRLITYQSGGFTNYGISYRKYSPDELEERTMQTEFNTRPKTKKNETDYIAELHKDLTDYGEKQYTNFYDFVNGDRVKITVEIVEEELR